MRSRYVGPVIAAVSVRLFVAVLIRGRVPFPDEQTYLHVGTALAQGWHFSLHLNPAASDLAGSVAVGYYLYVAAIFFLFGPSLLVLSLLNAVASGFSAHFAGRLGEHFGVGLSSAWLVALYPTAVLWGSTGLKDGLLATLFLASVVWAFEPPSLPRALGQVALVSWLFFTRPLLGAVAFGLAVAPLLRSILATRKGRIAAVLGLAGMAWIALKVVLPNFLEAAPATASNLSIYGVVRGLLGPFPWSWGQGVTGLGEAQYPGQILFILLIPAGFLGTWRALRGGGQARWLALAMVAYLLIYQSVEVFSEGFFRQRFDAELLLLIFALYALRVMPSVAIDLSAAWLCFIPLAALVQAGVLPPVGVVLVVAVIGAGLWLGSRHDRRSLLPTRNWTHRYPSSAGDRWR
jgi:hypothetical protein